MTDDLKQMRRERDKYRDKFENIDEDFDEIKRQRALKHDDKRVQYRDSKSPDEYWKKDSR